ncbi:uncharacterized protein K441DRAFT_653738 [Cenococcum geophilum 1.58]|uniref:uncharacterized protein n=1 Tax=Cenococcum geophilum 1.58 TaxID=794803 RepID=UPI00358F29EA|nr:hypothetical protein K441DRAFT_653738 [Cenococcum geophilum 1.58]
MSNNKASSLPTPPSLQDLTVSKFESLEPGQQEALFHTLRIEIARLQEIEKDWCRLTWCPRLDTQIHLPSTRIEPGGSEDDADGEDDGYKQMDMFREKWSYSENEHETSTTFKRDTSWHSYDLHGESADSDLGLCTTHLGRCGCSTPWEFGFSARISSQLLLYRITVIFGMPPPRVSDGFKVCWEVELKHIDGSVLRFNDWKGSASTGFNGSTDASSDGLKLLNFLIGLECLHTYGMRAGIMA